MKATAFRYASIGALALLGQSFPAMASGTISTVGSSSVIIPFAAGVSQGKLIGSPALAVSIGGGPVQTFIMDTGSAGMVVTPDIYTPPAGMAPLYTNVVQAYASNGVMYTGDVYSVEIQIGSGTNRVLSTTPILVAQSAQCIPGRSCGTPTLSGWTFMGVGFGESTTGTTNWPLTTTQRNPLFNVTEINGQPASPSKGWIMQSTGISVGLTAQNIQPFGTTDLDTLTPSSDGFNRGRASVSVNGGPAKVGSVLVDSGIQYAFLQPALSAVPATVNGATSNPTCNIDAITCTAPGNGIGIFLGDPTEPAMSYTVNIAADGSPSAIPNPAATPEFINQLTATTEYPYWNTGYHFFNAYSYLFSADDGVVGYAPLNQTPSPLPLAGAVGALTWSRRLRRRLAITRGRTN